MNSKMNHTAEIPELISSLKSAFQKSVFEKVESILISREKKFNQEIESLKADKKLLEVQIGGEKLEKIGLQTELSQLKEENLRLKDEKLRSERAYRKKFDELAGRVSTLDEELTVLKNSGSGDDLAVPVPTAGLKQENGKSRINQTGGERPLLAKPVDVVENDEKCPPVKVTCAREIQNTPSRQTAVETASELFNRKRNLPVNVTDNEDSCPATKRKTTEVWNLSPAPVSSPVRRCSTATKSCGPNVVGLGPILNTPVSPLSGLKMGMNSGNFVLNVTSSSSSSDSDDEIDTSVEFPIDFLQSNGPRKRWESAANMFAAFARDDDLCMKAVCALYRQQRLVNKSSSTSQNKGFNRLDSRRVTYLAEFLINGNPDGELKKSKEELTAYDDKGLEDCRRFAMRHYNQLFEMYQNQEYPFFLK